jgi:hypothetical protein
LVEEKEKSCQATVIIIKYRKAKRSKKEKDTLFKLKNKYLSNLDIG